MLALLEFSALGIPMVSVGSCQTTAFEKRLTSLTAALFADGSIGAGSVVDCGANEGGEACHYASLDGNRTIHALEPLPSNIKLVRRYVTTYPNIEVTQVALGSAERRVAFRGTQQVRAGGTHVAVSAHV